MIDITGDQYKNKKLKFTEPVYNGPRADGFHDKFELDEPLHTQGLKIHSEKIEILIDDTKL